MRPASGAHPVGEPAALLRQAFGKDGATNYPKFNDPETEALLAQFDPLLDDEERRIALSGEVAQVLWFARLDGAGLDAASAGALAGRIEALRAAAAGALPGVRLEQSPEAAITSYRQANAALTAQLVVFSAPVLGLVVIFIALVGGLAAQGRGPENGVGDGVHQDVGVGMSGKPSLKGNFDSAQDELAARDEAMQVVADAAAKLRRHAVGSASSPEGLVCSSWKK